MTYIWRGPYINLWTGLKRCWCQLNWNFWFGPQSCLDTNFRTTTQAIWVAMVYSVYTSMELSKVMCWDCHDVWKADLYKKLCFHFIVVFRFYCTIMERSQMCLIIIHQASLSKCKTVAENIWRQSLLVSLFLELLSVWVYFPFLDLLRTAACFENICNSVPLRQSCRDLLYSWLNWDALTCILSVFLSYIDFECHLTKLTPLAMLITFDSIWSINSKWKLQIL